MMHGKVIIINMEDNSKLFTQLHFNALIEDYKAREQETLKQIELTHQTFYVGVYLTGFLLAATPFIIQYEFFILFGVFSLFVYLSALTQLRHMWVVAAHDNYLTKFVVKDIKDLLGNLIHKPSELEDLMSWKTKHCKDAYLPNKLMLIEHSRIIFPVFAGTAFFILFLQQSYLRIIDAALAIFKNSNILWLIIPLVNLILLIYVIFAICSLYKKYIPSLGKNDGQNLGTGRK
jgi:hypothetical protein